MLSKSTVLFYILFPYYCYGDEVYCERFMEYFPLTTPFIIFLFCFLTTTVRMNVIVSSILNLLILFPTTAS